MTNKGTDQVGIISAIPNFVCIFIVPITGTFMDYCQNKSNLNISQVRRAFSRLDTHTLHKSSK